MNINDKVVYKGVVAYIHHMSEEGFTKTIWLYGVPESIKRNGYTHEPATLDEIIPLIRKTDFTKFLNGEIALDLFWDEDIKELSDVCKKNGISTDLCDINCYWKRLWFIKNKVLHTVQTKKEAEEIMGFRNVCTFIEYIYENEI